MTATSLQSEYERPSDTPEAAERRPAGKRLLIASNRQPFELSRSATGTPTLRRTTGGVTSALLPIVNDSGGKWVAGNADTHEHGLALIRSFPNLRLVDVSPEDVDAYYLGLSNSTLWPLCHYFVDRCRFRLADWDGYQRVNRKFAACLAGEYEAGDVVWVHDYHLCLVPRLLRRDLRDSRIAYFHHIPFPAPDVFRVLPWFTDILAGLLGADQVGFHTESYKRNFLETCTLLPGARVDLAADMVFFEGHATRVGAFPIGIDVEEIDQIAKSSATRREAARIRRDLRVDKLLLGVDRLDYTKGIVQRFEAMDTFLDNHPNLKGAISLLQIAVPSRENVSEYRALKRQVDELIGQINGKHSSNGWQPIHCTYRSFAPRRLVAYYQAADAALVTPVRDGMNLVAKEFCAGRTDGDGVLVLSEFAGAAEQLGSAAVLVNPYNVVQFADAIERAISMGPDERRRRMTELRNIVATNDVEGWVNAILEPLSHRTATELPLPA